MRPIMRGLARARTHTHTLTPRPGKNLFRHGGGAAVRSAWTDLNVPAQAGPPARSRAHCPYAAALRRLTWPTAP